MITPEQLARSNSEHGHQAALFCYAANSGIPELKWLFAIPNGFYATTAQKSKMKAEGLRAGVTDLMLPVPRVINDYMWHGMFVEMKRPKITENELIVQVAGKLNPDQEDFRDFVLAQGYQHVVCYTWIEAKNVILKYLGRG